MPQSFSLERRYKINVWFKRHFGHLMQRADSLEKTLMREKIVGKRRRGEIEDEKVGWHQ